MTSWRTLYLTSFCRSDRIFVCCLRLAVSFWWGTPAPWVLLRSHRFWVSQSRSLRSWWSRVYDSVWWAQNHPCQSWFQLIYSTPSASKWSKPSPRRSLIWLSDRKNKLVLKASVLQALSDARFVIMLFDSYECSWTLARLLKTRVSGRFTTFPRI